MKKSISGKLFNNCRKKLLKYLIVVVILSSIITFVTAQSSVYKIFIIGDSTVCNYAEDKYPWAG